MPVGVGARDRIQGAPDAPQPRSASLMPAPPFALQVPLSGALLALASWLGLDLLARRCRPDGLLRPLLQRSRLSLSATLLLAPLVGWLFDRLEAVGWDLPRDGRELRDVVLTLGVIWTLLRLKGCLLIWLAEQPLGPSGRERMVLIDGLDKLLLGAVVLLGGLQVLRLLGIPAMLLFTASGIGAAAVGFGARLLVENLFSGLMLYLNRPFTVGDLVELPERRLVGSVRAIGAYYTELVEADGRPLYVPNALFSAHAIVNASRRQERRELLELPLRAQDAAALAGLAASLRSELTGLSGLRPGRPLRVHGSWSEAGPSLRIEAYAESDLDQALELRQELLLRAVAVLERHGAALAERPA